MNPSVTYALTQAFYRVGHVLFKPFNISKWFILGFCAWLAALGEGGGGGSNFHSGWSGGPGGGGGGGGEGFDTVIDWIRNHLELVILLAVLIVLVGVAIALVLAWLRARGQFMFLDGVARNRAAVTEPWHRFRHLANSLFWFSLVLGLSGFLGYLLIVGLGVLVALPDIRAWHFGLNAIAAIVLSAVLSLPWAILMMIISAVLHDFIVPIMYLRNVRTLDAWRIFRYEIAPGQLGNFVLFYLLGIALVLGIATVAMVATCLTCCLAALPYIGTVILLPLYVFMRSYSLYFLQQFGQQWHIFEDEPIITPVPPYPPMAGPVG
jgi:hypothetical protein